MSIRIATTDDEILSCHPVMSHLRPGYTAPEFLACVRRQHGEGYELHLDSGVQRYGAHRFYLRHGMDITSHHFRLVLS